MAKVTGPLLSIGSQGQIAKSLVFASWRGIQYARRHVTPNNPKTTAQQTVRNTFDALDFIWKMLQTESRAPWTANAKGRPYTNRNQVISTNLPLMRGQPDRQDWQGSPGANGGLAPASITVAATATSGELQIDVTAPAIPVGWSILRAAAHAFEDGDPAVRITDVVAEGTDPTDPFSIILTGLPNTLHVASAWIVWQREDGATAYGPSLTGTATPLA